MSQENNETIQMLLYIYFNQMIVCEKTSNTKAQKTT